jgi:hypothetical protein
MFLAARLRVRTGLFLCLTACCFPTNLFAIKQLVTLNVVSGNGQTGNVSSVLPSTLVVLMLGFDMSGNPVIPQAGRIVDFTVTSPPSASGAAVSNASAVTASDGTASTHLTLGNLPGTYQVTVTCDAHDTCAPLAPAVFTETAAGTQLTLAIPPASAGGNQQSGSVGSLLANPLVVKTTKPDGTPAPGTTISFAITQQPVGATGATLSTLNSTTAGDGTASTQLTLGTLPDQYQVTASCGAGATCVPSSVVFTETAQALAITLVDPVPSLVSDGAVVTDTGLLSTQGSIVSGVAADGVTQVVIRIAGARPTTL